MHILNNTLKNSYYEYIIYSSRIKFRACEYIPYES